MKSEIQWRRISALGSVAFVLACIIGALAVVIPSVNLGRSLGSDYGPYATTLKAENLAVSGSATVGGQLTVGSCVGCGAGGISGLTTNTLPKATSSTTLGNSLISEIGGTLTSFLRDIDVNGVASFESTATFQDTIFAIDAQFTGGVSIDGTTKVQQLISTQISPAAVTGTVNDWAPTGLSTSTTVFVTSSSGSVSLTGITGGANGRRLTIVNADTTNSLFIRNENAGSTAANRFVTGYADDILLVGNLGASVTIEYWASRWHVVATNTYAPPLLAVQGQVTVAGLIQLASNGNIVTSAGTVEGALLTTASFGVYMNGSGLGFQYFTAGAATGYINPFGNSGTTSDFRSLEIDDGKGSGATHAIETLDGPTHHRIVAGTAPTLSSCATSTITGNDQAGVITIAGGATTCTITFATTYTTEPPCIMAPMGTGTQPVYTVSATAIIATSVISGQKYHYQCVGL